MTDVTGSATIDDSADRSEKVAGGGDGRKFLRIDHIALAVNDIDKAIFLFETVLGFELMQRRHVQGRTTGMLSAEFEANGIRFVVCQGTEKESQVAQLVENFGVGVAHVALGVEDVDETVRALKASGLDFDTDVIRGAGLVQAFSSRCATTGLSFEFIQRDGEGFEESNIQDLFEQLERSGKY